MQSISAELADVKITIILFFTFFIIQMTAGLRWQDTL
jgi:hypothetical protein